MRWHQEPHAASLVLTSDPTAIQARSGLRRVSAPDREHHGWRVSRVGRGVPVVHRPGTRSGRALLVVILGLCFFLRTSPWSWCSTTTRTSWSKRTARPMRGPRWH